jgi:hypothetical protein
VPRVRIIHWKEPLAGPLIDEVRAAGYEVEFDAVRGNEVTKLVRANPPDAIVFDLSRLPSHSREVAAYLRGTKYARHIPLIFVDGEAEKVESVRRLLPDATYTTIKRVGAAIKKACAKPLKDPVRPPGIMERYSSRTLAEKLGIKAGSTVALMDPPRDYAAALGELPTDAELFEEPEEAQAITLWFVRDPNALQMGIRGMRTLATRTKLWIVWRKGTGELTDKVVRELANGADLVDYKICAVNAQWSAMAFARRKS